MEFRIPIPSYKTLPPSHQTQLLPAKIGFDGKGVYAYYVVIKRIGFIG